MGPRCFLLAIVSTYAAGVFPTSVYAARVQTPYAVVESHSPSQQWKRLGSALKETTFQMKIGLEQSGFDELESILYEGGTPQFLYLEGQMPHSVGLVSTFTISDLLLNYVVSDPSNDRYGQYLSKDEVEELIKPTDEAYSAVQDWLLSNGIETYQTNVAKDWIYLNVSVGTAETLLNTNYHIYQDSKTGSREIRAPTWSLPQALHRHIAVIHPTSYFPARSRKAAPPPKPVAVSSVSSDCNAKLVTPGCLRKLYKTSNYTPQAADQNRVAIANFLNQTTIISDTQTFLKQHRPEHANFDVEIVSIANGSTSQNETDVNIIVEANLDAQMVTGSSVPTPLTIFATGGLAPVINGGADNEPYLVFLEHVLARENEQIPGAINFSYEDGEITVPFSYARAVCRGFAQLGVRGVSTLFSSGDGSECLAKGKVVGAAFPSSCPYVTSVGGTFQFNPEVAANDGEGYITGGSFSNYFAMPDYQKETIQRYIDSLPEELRGRFNASGRAYPDISAQSVNLATILFGRVNAVGGTSASSPIITGIISLLNDVRLANGLPTLGFLNPFLYQRGFKGLTDIVKGNVTPRGCNGTGFPVGKGWDPATGLGTPDFEKLRKLVLEVGS